MTFLEKLDLLMQESNLNKHSLALQCGIPYTTIDALYKKGYDNIKLSTIRKIASFFNTTLDYLIDDTVLDVEYGKEVNKLGIGKRIKEAREMLGYTQKQLGEAVGVTGSAITNYENETSHPKEPVMYKLLGVLNVDANFLFQDEMKPPIKKIPLSAEAEAGDMRLSEIIDIYNDINEEGREKLADYASDLEGNPRYKKESQFKLGEKEA